MNTTLIRIFLNGISEIKRLYYYVRDAELKDCYGCILTNHENCEIYCQDCIKLSLDGTRRFLRNVVI